MRTTKLACLVLAAALALMVAGCGSNRDSDGSSAGETGFGTDPATGFSRVGAAICISCHQDFSWSEQIVQDYLSGIHVVHSDHISQANADEGCLECHDPIGDGPTLEQFLEPENIPEGGLAAVGCENCHGAGGEHFGVGPVPEPTPNFEVCGQCHKTLPESHLPFHPEGNDIITKYENSRHRTASIRNEAICAKCHTDEGGRLYKHVQTRESLFAHVLPVEGEGSPVQCRTCHNPHKPNELLLEELEDHGHVVASAEWATCTNCHMSDQASIEADLATGELISTDLLYHEDRHMRVITDTHYDDPATVDLVEGYVVDHHGEKACRVCHDVHDVQEIRADRDTMTINDQWAESAHAGHILTAKKEVMQDYIDMDLDRTPGQTLAMKQAGIDGEPFIHASDVNGWDNIGELGCQRCHTATGGKNFLQGPADYEAAVAAYQASGDPADAPNDFSYLADWTPEEGSGQTELIYCWTCHADNSGNLNDPGEIPFPSGAVASLGGGSNVCMACHQGRESGLSVADAVAEGDGPFGFINRHYFAAAAILFGSEVDAGFEYRAKDAYRGQNTFPGHGDDLSNCVQCHLRGEADHHFLPELADCSGCHSGITDFEQLGLPFGAANVDYDGDGTGESFQGEIDGMEARLLSAIQTYAAGIGAPIIYQSGSYPYFFKDTNGNGSVDAGEANFGNRYTSFDATLLKAAYNFHSNQDPCGDMHNYQYVLQTIYDSMDDLDDGQQNNSVANATRPGQTTPPPGNGGGAPDGAALYAGANCNACHGADGGGVGAFPNIQNISLATLQGAPGGVGTHGSIAGWSAEEQQAVVDFLAGL